MSTVYCHNCERAADHTHKGKRYCLPCLTMFSKGFAAACTKMAEAQRDLFKTKEELEL